MPGNLHKSYGNLQKISENRKQNFQFADRVFELKSNSFPPIGIERTHDVFDVLHSRISYFAMADISCAIDSSTDFIVLCSLLITYVFSE